MITEFWLDYCVNFELATLQPKFITENNSTFAALNEMKGQEMNKKLYRSIADKKLCGVCGGIGEYFDLDPTLIRILWIVFALLGGSGLLAYIICAIIMPSQNQLPNP